MIDPMLDGIVAGSDDIRIRRQIKCLVEATALTNQANRLGAKTLRIGWRRWQNRPFLASMSAEEQKAALHCVGEGAISLVQPMAKLVPIGAKLDEAAQCFAAEPEH